MHNSCCPCHFNDLVITIVDEWCYPLISVLVHFLWCASHVISTSILAFTGKLTSQSIFWLWFLFEGLDTTELKIVSDVSLAGAAHLSNDIGGALGCTSRGNRVNVHCYNYTLLFINIQYSTMISPNLNEVHVLSRITLVQFLWTDNNLILHGRVIIASPTKMTINNVTNYQIAKVTLI